MNRTDVGIFGSGTGTGFFNQGIIDIGHTAGIRSAGVFLSSSAYFENQSGSFLNIDQTGIGVAIANGIQLSGSASFSNAGILSLGITAPIKTHGIQLTNPSTFTNTSSGIVNIDRTLGLFAILPKSGTNFINQGQVNIGTIAQVNHGIGDDAGTGGTVTNTGTLTFDDILLDGIYSNQTIANNSGGAIAIPSGGKLRIASLGVLNCAAGSNTTNSGTMTNIGTINCAGSFDNQGIYSGTGIFNNSLFSNPSNGIVSPGLSPGCLQFTNGWTSIGALQVEINGVNPCVDFDQIQVTGNAQVGGTLHLNFGFAPSCGQTFQIVDADSYTGSFSGITTTPSNMVATYSNGLITVWDDQMAILNVQDGLYYCTIADALAASMTNDGDVIEIPAGTYNEPCLLIDKSVVLKPMGSVTIDCLKMDGTGKIMVLDGDLTTNTLNLTNGLIRTNGHNLKCGSITGGGPGSYVVTD
jgi:phage baseplate assembly protein gpV